MLPINGTNAVGEIPVGFKLALDVQPVCGCRWHLQKQQKLLYDGRLHCILNVLHYKLNILRLSVVCRRWTSSHQENSRDGSFTTVDTIQILVDEEVTGEWSSAEGGENTCDSAQPVHMKDKIKERKRAIKRKKVTEEDKCLQVMGKYFERKMSNTEVRKETVPRAADRNDDDELFGEMIAVELKKIPDGSAKRRLKQQLMTACYDAVEAAERRIQLGQQQLISWVIPERNKWY